MGESVQETIERGGLRPDIKPRHIADYRIKAISVDRRVINGYIKGGSCRLSYSLKIRNFETTFRLAKTEVILETHYLYLRKS